MLRSIVKMDALMFLTLALLGFIRGIFSGWLGIGGGILMVPLLLYVPPLLNLNPLDMKEVAGLTMAQGFFAFAQASSAVPPDLASRIGALRLRRKRVASICMFVVLAVSMMGVQVWDAFPLWLTVLLIIAIAAFTWRAYKSVTPYGWI